MFRFIHELCEEKIRSAIRNGEFDNLQGAGQPLDLEEDIDVPPVLRMAYKIMKNAGCLPPELEQEKEINNALELLSAMQDEKERYRQIRKLNYLVMKLNMNRRNPIDLEKHQLYYDEVVSKVGIEPE